MVLLAQGLLIVISTEVSVANEVEKSRPYYIHDYIHEKSFVYAKSFYVRKQASRAGKFIILALPRANAWGRGRGGGYLISCRA